MKAEYVTLKKLYELRGLRVNTARKYIQRGILKCKKLEGLVYISLDHFDKLIESQEN